MKTFVVMAPPEFEDLDGDPNETDRLKFVPDGFSVLAFLFSIIWMLVHRMWLVLLGYLALTLLIELLALTISGPAVGVAAVTMSLIFAFEAQALRRWSLTRKGWRVLGVVEAVNQEDAEIRFLHRLGTLHTQSHTDRDPNSSRPAQNPIIPRVGSEQVVGLMLGPETRQ